MCRFLLSKQADVDVHSYVAHSPACPILYPEVNLFEASPAEVGRMQECCRLLLEAGADPMDTPDLEYWGTPFFLAFSSGDVVSQWRPRHLFVWRREAAEGGKYRTNHDYLLTGIDEIVSGFERRLRQHFVARHQGSDSILNSMPERRWGILKTRVFLSS